MVKQELKMIAARVFILVTGIFLSAGNCLVVFGDDAAKASKKHIVTGDSSAQNLVLGDQESRLTLSPQGLLLSLKDLTTGVELIAAPRENEKVWTLDRKDGSLSNVDYATPLLVRAADREIVFTWSGKGLPTVEGHVEFDPKQHQFRLSVKVVNVTAEEIDGIVYPAKMSFSAQSDNYLIVVSDDNFLSLIKPLKDLKSFGTVYPGFMSMQLAGFKIGNSALLTYTDDPNAHVKEYRFKSRSECVDFEVNQTIGLKPGARWEAPYGLVLKVIPHGSYNEMAAEYGKWGRAQPWAVKKLADKVAERPLLKKMFDAGIIRVGWPPIAWGPECFTQDKDGHYHYIEGTKYAQYEPYFGNILKTIADYESRYGITPGYWMAAWNGCYFDTAYPDYFPVRSYMGSFDDFKKVTMARQYPMMYHMNIVHWPVTSATASNSIYHVQWKGSQIRQRWSNVEHIFVNLGKSIEVEMKTVERLKDDRGVSGVYLDVIGHAFVMDESHSNPFCGRPNAYQLAKVDSFKQIRNGVTGPMMTEGRNEILLPYVDISYGTCGTLDIEDQIPMWEMVYGDCVATHPFNSMGGHRNLSMMQGGIFGLPWEWPDVQGKNVEIFIESTQQKVLSNVIGERMLRFDRIGKFRISHWQDGTFIWNRGKDANSPVGPAKPDGAAEDVAVSAPMGSIQVRRLAPDGAVMLTTAGDFSAESVGEVSLNEKTLFKSDSSSLLVAKAGGRWLIWNKTDAPVKAVIRVAGNLQPAGVLSGKAVVTGTAVNIFTQKNGSGSEFSVSLPASECLVMIDGL